MRHAADRGRRLPPPIAPWIAVRAQSALVWLSELRGPRAVRPRAAGKAGPVHFALTSRGSKVLCRSPKSMGSASALMTAEEAGPR